MQKPLVSVLCPSYNHEKYVKFFIESLLTQTNPNWELIIVDDCSTDNNVNEIKKFKDKRIKLIQHDFNMGITCGLNDAIKFAHGDYISLCASDDILLPDYIDYVICAFKNNPKKDIIYFDLKQIDDKNKVIKRDILKNIKADKNTIIRHLFMFGNCLLSPGMVVRANVFKTIIPFNISLSLYHDYKMHIDLLLNHDFMVADGFHLYYRKPNKKSGISFFSEKTLRIGKLEESVLMDSFLKIKNTKVLQDIFNGDLDEFGEISDNLIPFVLGMLALRTNVEYKQVWGYSHVSSFINNIQNYKLLNKKCGFCYRDFLNLSSYFGINPIKKKYLKYKKLFNILLIFAIFLLFFVAYMSIMRGVI